MRRLYILLFVLLPVITNAQTWEWAKTGAGIMPSTDAQVAGITTDRFGHVYSVGFFSFPTITVGGISLSNPVSTGLMELLIVKSDTAGNIIWTKTAPVVGIMENYCVSVATDAAGSVYVTGFFEANSITFDAITLTASGYGDMFIVKYDSLGNVNWAKRGAGWGNMVEPTCITTGKSGNVYLTGVFGGNFSVFGTDTLHTIGGVGYQAIFLIKFDPSGNVIWKKTAGAVSNNVPYGIATDSHENIYLSAACDDTSTTFGSTAFATKKLVLAKYDSTGNTIWVKGGGANFNDAAGPVAVDTADNIYMAGSFLDTSITFGTTTLSNTTPGTADMFLVKYDPAGSVLWAKSAGSSTSDFATALTTDYQCNVYLAGNFAGPSITFGTDVLTQAGSGDFFVAKYNSSGSIQWGKRVGGAGGDEINAICADPVGNLYAGGKTFTDTLYFGTCTTTDSVSTAYDFFIAKLRNTLPTLPTYTPVANAQQPIDIYPNPATTELTIVAPGLINRVTITNLMGQLMYEGSS